MKADVEMDIAYLLVPWAFFRGYICTSNGDGSIPLNSKCVLDARFAPENEAQIIVAVHNRMIELLNKAALQ